MDRNLSADEIRHWQPYPMPGDTLAPLERTRRRLDAHGQWAPWQVLGRRSAIGCVALEITQRCNLDCSYCYLSESSEALKDIPLAEVFRRIDLIHAHYGDNTDVQVTGGEPTLRKRDDLVAIVRYVRQRKLRPSLFTNGIKAHRDLLAELASVGLIDVAFHVDLTQERQGHASESSLNAVRREYLERARGLGLSVFFNTTIYPGNFQELPELVRFFVAHSDVVRLASFQIGADSGRGVERERVAINPETVALAIQQGAGTTLNFGAASAGHSACNRYGYALVINGRLHDLLGDAQLVAEVMARTVKVEFNRSDKWKTVRGMAAAILGQPDLAPRVLWKLAGIAWRARRDLIGARGRVGKLSFFVHNFMDAKALDRERCHACSFMVMTPEGPMSMCVHNAKRDDYLLVPAAIKQGAVVKFWNPADGRLHDRLPERIQVALSRKTARGRARALPLAAAD